MRSRRRPARARARGRKQKDGEPCHRTVRQASPSVRKSVLSGDSGAVIGTSGAGPGYLFSGYLLALAASAANLISV